jgi:hypothetical protein
MNTRSSTLLLSLHFSCNYQCSFFGSALISYIPYWKKARINLCKHFITKYKIPVILWTVSSKDVWKSNPSSVWPSVTVDRLAFMILIRNFRFQTSASTDRISWSYFFYVSSPLTRNHLHPKLDHWRFRPHLLQFIIC